MTTYRRGICIAPNGPAILALADDWTALGATPEQATRIAGEGWRVVNAPRPLPGPVDWSGPFGHGSFYAAGPDVWEIYPGARLVPLAQRWHEYDAWPVELVDNDRVVAILIETLGRDGYRLDEMVEALGSVAATAEWAGLPWHHAADPTQGGRHTEEREHEPRTG